MPFQQAPNVMEATTVFSQAGQLVENKYYFHSTDAVTEAMCQLVADAVGQWVVTSLFSQLTDALHYVRTVVRDLTVDGSFEATSSTGAGTGGNAGSSALPNNVTIAIHRSTGLSGRFAKSRVYIPGLNADAVIEGTNTLSATRHTGLLAAYNALLGQVQAAAGTGVQEGYLQRVKDGVPLVVAHFVTCLSWTFVDTIVDSMRRRLPGRGR